MVESDVNVVASLQLRREEWLADLAASKTDLERTAQEMARTPLRIPVEVDLAQVTSAIQRLRSELAMSPLVIPVQFQPMGGPISGMPALRAAVEANAGVTAVGGPATSFSRYLSRTASPAAGVEPYDVNEFSGGGDFALAPAYAQYGASSPVSYLPRPSYEPLSAFPAMNMGQRLSRYNDIAEASRSSGPGLLGGMVRGMAMMHVAFSAAEGMEKAFAERDDFNEAEGMKDSAAGARLMAKALHTESGNFYGIPKFARNLFARATGDSTVEQTIEDLDNSAKASTGFDKRAQGVRHISVLERELGYTDASGSFFGQSLSAKAASAEASLSGGSKEEYARIDQEHQAQMDAIKKRYEKLKEQGISEKLLTDEMKGLVESADRIANADRMRLMKREAGFMSDTQTIEMEARGDMEGARQNRRAIRARELIDQYGDTPATRARIAALNNKDDYDDQLRGAGINSSTKEMQLRFSGDIRGAQDEAINRQAFLEIQKDPANRTAITDYAREKHVENAAEEFRRNQSLENRIAELGIDGAYERRRQTDLDNAAMRVLADPTHADLIGREFATSRIAQDRELTLANGRLFGQASDMRTATGTPGGYQPPVRRYGETLSEFQGRTLAYNSTHQRANPQLAAALDFEHDIQNRLAEHPEQANAIREWAKQGGLQMEREQHITDPKARQILENIASVAPARNGAGTSGETAEFKNAADSLRVAAETLKSAERLYYIKH